MLRFFIVVVTLIAVTLPNAQAFADEAAALIPPKAIGLDFAANCDKNIAVYRMRNTGERWHNQAMISFVGAKGVVLFQRAIRMTNNQTMSYRVHRPSVVGAVTAYVDYPGVPRQVSAMGAPCR